MLDTELLEIVLAQHDLNGESFRRNEHESTIELAARVLHVALTSLYLNAPMAMAFGVALENSRTAPEWRVKGMFE